MNNRVYVLCKKSVTSSDKNEIVTFPVTTIVYLRKIDNTPCFPQKNSIMKQYVECWWNGLLCHFIFRPIFPVSMKAFHVPVGSEHQYLCFLSRLNAAFFGICDNSKCSVTDNERWELFEGEKSYESKEVYKSVFGNGYGIKFSCLREIRYWVKKRLSKTRMGLVEPIDMIAFEQPVRRVLGLESGEKK